MHGKFVEQLQLKSKAVEFLGERILAEVEEARISSETLSTAVSMSVASRRKKHEESSVYSRNIVSTPIPQVNLTGLVENPLVCEVLENLGQVGSGSKTMTITISVENLSIHV